MMKQSSHIAASMQVGNMGIGWEDPKISRINHTETQFRILYFTAPYR